MINRGIEILRAYGISTKINRFCPFFAADDDKNENPLYDQQFQSRENADVEMFDST